MESDVKVDLTYGVIIRPLGERFAGLIVEPIDTGPVVREIVNAT
jgi:hypothetical protein